MLTHEEQAVTALSDGDRYWMATLALNGWTFKKSPDRHPELRVFLGWEANKEAYPRVVGSTLLAVINKLLHAGLISQLAEHSAPLPDRAEAPRI